jgi:hypothetical protein
VSVLDRSLFTPIGDGAYNDPDHMRRFDYTSIPATTSNVVPVPVSNPTIPQDDPQVEETGLGPDEFMIDGTIFTVGADFEERVKSREIDGVTLYPIINAPGAKFGSNVERILREFTQEDVPFGLGSFEDRGTFFRPEDVGSAVQDTGLDLLNIFETPVRGIAGFFGELAGGPKGKKEFQSYIPEAPSDLDRGLNKASYIGEITDFTDPISEIEKDDENITPTVTEKTPEELEAEQQMTIDKGLQEIYELSKGTVADPQAGLKEEPEKGEGEGESKQQKALNLFQFDDPKVNRFLRNVGSALVKEGQFTGLGTGAAAFAEEEAQRDLLEEQRMADLMKEAAKSGTLDFKDRKTLYDTKAELGTHVRDFNNAEAAYELAQSVIDFANKNVNLATFGAKIGATLKDIGAAIGFNRIENVEDLDDTKRAQIALDILANRNIKEILGESGRTISNIDRDIANRIIGNLSMTKIQSIPELKQRLEDNMKSIVEKKNDAQRKIIASTQFLIQYMPNLFAEDPELFEIYQKDFGVPEGSIKTASIDTAEPRVVKTTLRG